MDKEETSDKKENLNQDRETIDTNTQLIHFDEDNPFSIDNKKRFWRRR